MSFRLVFLCLLAGAASGCVGKEGNNTPPSGAVKSIEQVQREYEAGWMAMPGVVGVGIGECKGRPCLKVFVDGSGPAPSLPRRVEGYAVEVVESGPIEALEES